MNASEVQGWSTRPDLFQKPGALLRQVKGIRRYLLRT